MRSGAAGRRVVTAVPSHLLPLPGGEWRIWRCAGLRGTGFAASGVLALAAPESAARAAAFLEGLEETRRPIREALDAEGGAALRKAFDSELVRIRGTLRDVARDRAFREAVLWQNRQALHTALDPLLQKTPAATDKKTRQREHLTASYLQRYCVKNDTVGFFGPVGWARLVTDGQPIRVRPGGHLLARREVYFEAWCVDALAATLAERPALRPWLAPRVLPYFRLEGRRLHIPSRGSVELSSVQARLLAACDGERPAKALAADVVADPSLGISEEEVYQLLDYGRQMGVISWTLELPLELYPERKLRRLLERVEDDEARTAALAALTELEAARARVGGAAGDPEQLDRAMAELEDTFTRLTGQPPTRSEGKTYAGRTLVYEDCRRDVEVEVGPAILHRLGPPLTLVLTSARWFTFEVARRVREVLDQVHDSLAREGGTPAVEMADFQAALLKMRESLSSIVREVQREFQGRWAEILSLPGVGPQRRYSSYELASHVHAAFDAPGPGWTLVRHVSPDVMIAGRDATEIERGEFELVLGELHPANTIMSSLFLAQHLHPEELVQAVEQDLGAPLVLPVLPKERYPQRLNLPFSASSALAYEFSADPSGCPASRVLRVGDLLVQRGEAGLEVRSRDGRWTFDVLEFMQVYLWSMCSGWIVIAPRARHTPRVTVDGLVISRERWELDPAEIPFADVVDPLERFLCARRWARGLGLPRFVFVKVAVEVKPCYVDLESPIFVDMLAKLVRRTREGAPADPAVVLTEMLPRTDQTWLTDAQGNRYTSELRLVVVDPRPVARPVGAHAGELTSERRDETCFG